MCRFFGHATEVDWPGAGSVASSPSRGPELSTDQAGDTPLDLPPHHPARRTSHQRWAGFAGPWQRHACGGNKTIALGGHTDGTNHLWAPSDLGTPPVNRLYVARNELAASRVTVPGPLRKVCRPHGSRLPNVGVSELSTEVIPTDIHRHIHRMYLREP